MIRLRLLLPLLFRVPVLAPAHAVFGGQTKPDRFHRKDGYLMNHVISW